MFKWTKIHGCNCHPVPENGERYLLLVGDLYEGRVETIHNPYNSKDIGWSASFRILGQEISGQSGGGLTRNEAMKWIEGRILDSIAAIEAVKNDPHREIYDALVHVDNTVPNGWYQERLE